jgi:riboflavin synthase
MFTGLIEAMGTCKNQLVLPEGGSRLDIMAPLFMIQQLTLGASIAIDGVCTTAIDFSDSLESGSETGFFTIEASPETLSKTTLSQLKPGHTVNLELPLKAGQPLGGHFVMGHVDGTGTLEAVEPDGLSWVLRFGFNTEEWNDWLLEKGSVAINGISLTVNKVLPNGFEVAIIPHTWQVTNLSQLTVGSSVNLEFDMLGKAAVKVMKDYAKKLRPLTPAAD